MSVSACVYMHVCVYACASAHTSPCMHVRACGVHSQVCAHVRALQCVCMNACASVCVYKHVYMGVGVQVCVHACVCMCECVCVHASTSTCVPVHFVLECVNIV